jgi:hypothetical protein
MLLMIGTDGAALSQDKATTQGSAAEMIPHLSDQDNDQNPARAAIDAKAKQQRYAEEQKKWIADAAKLATLANELKSYWMTRAKEAIEKGVGESAKDQNSDQWSMDSAHNP